METPLSLPSVGKLLRENAELKARVNELEACIKSHGIPVKTCAGGVPHYCIGTSAVSRIDIIGQNGNDGLHYEEDKHNW